MANLTRIIKSVAAFTKPAAILAVLVVGVITYNVVASSSLFELRRVEVSDAAPALRQEVEQVVRRAVGHTKMLDVDLTAIRHKIEALPRVRQATVARMLPDGLAIHVAERRPAVLVRRSSGSVVWIDEDAYELGEPADLKEAGRAADDQKVPPVVKGFSEGARSSAAVAEDRERLEIYAQLKRELGQGWGQVDEIDLTFPKNINVRLADSPVNIVLGSKEYRDRFEMALQILGAIRQGNADVLSRFRVQDAERLIQNAGHINFIDASRPDRIVLNFSTPGTEKPVRQEPPAQEARQRPETKQEVKPLREAKPRPDSKLRQDERPRLASKQAPKPNQAPAKKR